MIINITVAIQWLLTIPEASVRDLEVQLSAAQKKAAGDGSRVGSCWWRADSQKVQVSLQYFKRPHSKDIGITLGSRYIPYTYMDLLGFGLVLSSWT